jgi:hypothetical protein
MALHREELARCRNRTMAVVRRGIVKELLPVRRTGEGGDLKYQSNDRGGSDVAHAPHRSTDRQRRLHRRNRRIRQSARSEAKGELDDDRQRYGTGDADEGRIDINRDRHEGAQSEGDDTDDDGGLSHGICFYFEGEFHPLPTRSEKKNRQGLE